MKKGFTLAELLIVVAVIAVLVGISIPIFFNSLEKAKQATDLANMRSAYSEAITSWMTEHKSKYQFNIIGKSSKDVTTFTPESFPCEVVSSIPKDNIITITIDNEGNATLIWGSGYSGIISQSQWQNSTREQRLEADKNLIDSLTKIIHNMTYREIIEMFGTQDNPSDQVLKAENGWSHTCYTLATSYFDNTTGKINSDINHIYATQLFEQAGYNLNGDQYLISFWDKNNSSDPLYIKVDVGKTVKNMSERDLDKKATGAIIYLNGSGYNTRNGEEFGHNR